MNDRPSNVKPNILIAIIFAAFPFLCAATEGEEVLIICLALSIVVAVLWVLVWSIRKLFSSNSTTKEKATILGLLLFAIRVFLKVQKSQKRDSRGNPL